MKKLLLVLLLVLLVVPVATSAMDQACSEAVAAGGTNILANLKCLYKLAVDAMDPELCPFCTVR